ncbi:hypothetical protein M569_00847, partial [Genlisea aurea]
IPVDVYFPGCPPKPKAVLDAITKFRTKKSLFHFGRSINIVNSDQRFLYQPTST